MAAIRGRRAAGGALLAAALTPAGLLGERDGSLLVASRPCSLLAARMQQLGRNDGSKALAAHLVRLTGNESWRPFSTVRRTCGTRSG